MTGYSTPRKIRFYGIRDIETLPQLQRLSAEERFAMRVVAQVLPFRSNDYVVENLIDWESVPDDPMFQLTFPQATMLEPHQFERMREALCAKGSSAEIKRIAEEIRFELEPHPAGQMTANVPEHEGRAVPGVQHKYRETALVFPSQGQTCHAYCSFCFRWPQFVGMANLKLQTDEARRFAEYVRSHKEITDVLFTGGDPMIMKAHALETYIQPLLSSGFEHVRSIRIGSKALTYWPYRFLSDRDSERLLSLFERVVKVGKQLAFMAHFNHPVELSTPEVRAAVSRIRSTGAQIRSQSPLVRHVNDAAAAWARMWQEQVELGIIPYYMFIERPTGARNHFAIPLDRALRIYRRAMQSVSGLARTARGPSMSALPGKVCIDGVAEIGGERVFALRFLQGRNPDWVQRPFFARHDGEAAWLSELEPAFGDEEFFYAAELREHLADDHRLRSLHRGRDASQAAAG